MRGARPTHTIFPSTRISYKYVPIARPQDGNSSAAGGAALLSRHQYQQQYQRPNLKMKVSLAFAVLVAITLAVSIGEADHQSSY